ncbi:hypothetical protein CL630_03280 [bacterium]|nr:hypothetical protein [bacterium]|tara:strand:+ start:26794 stop:26973 length:180 start_codon:yes stop_codon:yes gene_type:complete
MLQIKTFGFGHTTMGGERDSEVNDWLAEAGDDIEVKQIVQSSDTSSITTLTFLYQKKES